VLIASGECGTDLVDYFDFAIFPSLNFLNILPHILPFGSLCAPSPFGLSQSGRMASVKYYR